MRNIIKTILHSSLGVLLVCTFAAPVWADAKANYEEKVKVNDQTIGVIAGVINYVCPKLVDPTLGICNPKDPVGTAVAIQKQMGDLEELDELDSDELEEELSDRKILHVDASMQFFDAMEQFKGHFPYREAARKAAAAGNWDEAFLNEEMAWQYLVKCASRGIFAKKMADGE